MPDSRIKLFDEQIRAVSKQSGQPIAGQPYEVKMPDGVTLQGVTDADGRTERIATATPENLKLNWLHTGTDEFPDVPADEGC